MSILTDEHKKAESRRRPSTYILKGHHGRRLSIDDFEKLLRSCGEFDSTTVFEEMREEFHSPV